MHYPDLTQANALEKMLSRPVFPTSTPKNNKESKEKQSREKNSRIKRKETDKTGTMDTKPTPK